MGNVLKGLVCFIVCLTMKNTALASVTPSVAVDDGFFSTMEKNSVQTTTRFSKQHELRKFGLPLDFTEASTTNYNFDAQREDNLSKPISNTSNTHSWITHYNHWSEGTTENAVELSPQREAIKTFTEDYLPSANLSNGVTSTSWLPIGYTPKTNPRLWGLTPGLSNLERLKYDRTSSKRRTNRSLSTLFQSGRVQTIALVLFGCVFMISVVIRKQDIEFIRAQFKKLVFKTNIKKLKKGLESIAESCKLGIAYLSSENYAQDKPKNRRRNTSPYAICSTKSEAR